MKHADHCGCITCELLRSWPLWALGLAFAFAGVVRLVRLLFP